MMKKHLGILALTCGAYVGSALAVEGPKPQGIPHLDHVFVIMMENHGYGQIIANPNAPFLNSYAQHANVAAQYYGVGHPSLTNYIETVGGSNFGIQSDNAPDWHNAGCVNNLSSGKANTDNPASPIICPIYGYGTDAATPLIDTTNEVQGTPGEINIDGVHAFPAANNIDGKSIADQLAAAGMSWKAYEEGAPMDGVDGVNYSDGYFTNKTDFTKMLPTLNPPLTSSNIVALYAAKHNPFVYFRSIQEGTNPRSSLKNTADFQGSEGLFADLARGTVPNFSWIAPNQCDDQHGQGNAGPLCNYDPNDNGTQAGLNPALVQRGDKTVERLVKAIKSSETWSHGNNAIVVIWDEDDYSVSPTKNQVVAIVDTSYGVKHTVSTNFYTHFSLLKSIEGGFSLPCLNHACDAGVNVMADLFAAGGNRDRDNDVEGARKSPW